MQNNDLRDVYLVLVNDDEQYSIWSAHHAIPNGWREVGPRGTREECVSYVDANWVDMRPKSLRQTLETP